MNLNTFSQFRLSLVSDAKGEASAESKEEVPAYSESSATSFKRYSARTEM
jgi:hypothetical protein